MACTIVIDEGTLLATTNAAGEVVRVDVEGDAEDCKELKVSLKDNSAGIDIGTVAPVVPDESGHWTVSFLQDQGFSFKGVSCGDKVEVTAECTDGSCKDNKEVPLPCKPGEGGGCPNVSVTVQPGACNGSNTARTMTFLVTVGGGAQIQYMWNFGDGSPLTPLATGSGNFQQVHSYTQDDTYFANLIIVVPPGCTATPDPITVAVDPCAPAPTVCPDNPRFVAERHLLGGQRDRVDLDAQCVPEGDYTISLSNAYPAGTQLTWYVDDNLAGQGATIDVTVGEGETVEIEVIADKDGCPPVSESVDLSGCTVCSDENELVLERRRPNGRRERVVVDEGCIPAGDYVIRLLEPEGDFAIDWFENGVLVPGEHGRTLPIQLEEGEQLTVSAHVEIPGCNDLNPSITIEACECPDDLSLSVFDQSGDPVDPAQCVAPGTYTVRAQASGLSDENTERTWRIDGSEVAGDGTERDVRVEAPVTACCFGDPPGTSVSVTASMPGCEPRTATVTLRPCAEYLFSICCQILGAIVLLLAGLTAVAAALAFCPQVLIFPPLVAFFVAFGFWIFLGLLVLLAIAVGIWFASCCKPDWCRDILPKLWQIALMAGIVFIYFGSCPLCAATLIGSLFIWGVILLLLGAGLLLWWILSCRPTQCLTVWRLIELGVVNSIIGAIVTVLGFLPAALGLAACVSPGALIFLWLINAFLDGLVLFLPLFCSFNPAAPAAFAFFRRPPFPRGTARVGSRNLSAPADRSSTTGVETVSEQRAARNSSPRSDCGRGRT